MAKIKPNEDCPCESKVKYKKCCQLYFKGKNITQPEILLRSRYTALSAGEVEFLWKVYHPQSMRKIHDTWAKFASEYHHLHQQDYQAFKILSLKFDHDEDRALAVTRITLIENQQDLSYLEEIELRKFENEWYYFNGKQKREFAPPSGAI
ncbi:hypothetical protein BVY03_00370 [bacterium K02(2017)]|nr:hypothetical protein BVY03_00370 [bacterium K02(2017)]